MCLRFAQHSCQCWALGYHTVMPPFPLRRKETYALMTVTVQHKEEKREGKRKGGKEKTDSKCRSGD